VPPPPSTSNQPASHPSPVVEVARPRDSVSLCSLVRYQRSGARERPRAMVQDFQLLQVWPPRGFRGARKGEREGIGCGWSSLILLPLRAHAARPPQLNSENSNHLATFAGEGTRNATLCLLVFVVGCVPKVLGGLEMGVFAILYLPLAYIPTTTTQLPLGI
jgi:hypothetical protein